MVGSEFNDLEDSALQGKLLELMSVHSQELDIDENTRLQCLLQAQSIKLEMQRRQLEALKHERDEALTRFTNLYDFTPIAYVTFDAAGRILEINLAGAALLGIERDRVLDSHFGTYLAADEASFLKHITQVLVSGQRHSLDIQLRDQSGYCYDIKLLSERYDAEDRPVCRSTIIDLTEQKQIEQEIRHSDEFSRSILNALPAQIAVLDGSGIIIAMNQAWRQLESEEGAPPVIRGKVGEDYLNWFSNGGKDVFRESPLVLGGIQAVIDGAQPEFKLEYASHTPEQKRWFLVWTTPMAGNSGGAVVAHVDISARILAQEEARKRGEALARAARLSSVGLLASELAHEITQPLTAVGQFSSTALAMMYGGETKPQELAEILMHIDNEVQRAAEVMRRLRTFMGRGAVARLPVGLRQILDAAVGLVSQKAMEKKTDIIIDLSDPSIGVVADQVQITQVLVNLLCNSIDAIDRAARTLRKVYIHCERDHDLIHVKVSDTGPGLAPEWRESIFDLFETDKTKGMGMGLAISRSIIEAHGGRLWAEPEPSEGAVFHFTLPATQKEIGVE